MKYKKGEKYSCRVIVTDCGEVQALCQLIKFGNHLSVGPETVDTHVLDFIGLTE